MSKIKKILALLLTLTIISLMVGIGPVSAYSTVKVINVASFGTDQGDNSNDDLPEILAALDTARPGDTVYFPDGTYNINGMIQLDVSGINIVGQSVAGTVIREMSSVNAAGHMLYGTYLHDITLKNITFNAMNSSYVDSAICFEYGTNILVTGCVVTDVNRAASGGVGVKFVSIEQSEISGNTIRNCGDLELVGAGIILMACSYIDIYNNTIDRGGYDGIGVSWSDHCVIYGNKITNTLGVASAIECYGASYIIVEDNIVDHFISMVIGSFCSVRRNVIIDTNPNGAIVWCGLEIGDRNSVYTGNQIKGGAMCGLSTSGEVSYIFAANNTVKDLPKANPAEWAVGMCIWGPDIEKTQGLYYFNNTFEGMSGASAAGASLDNAKNITFEECTFKKNTDGIVLQAWNTPCVEGLYLKNCKIENNQNAFNTTGITEISKFAAENCVVKNNNNNSMPADTEFATSLPVASFSAPVIASAGTSVAFTSTSVASGSSIVHYLWDFDDGYPSTEAKTTHTYEKQGLYNVTLIVWNEEGRASRVTKSIRITGNTVTAPLTPPEYSPMQGVTNIDNKGTSVTYSGKSWQTIKDDNCYNGTMIAASVKDDSVEYKFFGTEVQYIATKDSNMGKADVYLDGARVATVDLYSFDRKYQQVAYQVTGLPEGFHSIRIAVSGRRNLNSGGTLVSFDEFICGDNGQLCPSDRKVITVDDSSSMVGWGGTPHYLTGEGYYNGTETNCNDTVGFVQLTFAGTGIKYYASTGPDMGIADVYIDGVKVSTVDQYSAETKFQQLLYSVDNLSLGTHVIKIMQTTSKNPASSGNYFSIDYFQYE